MLASVAFGRVFADTHGKFRSAFDLGFVEVEYTCIVHRQAHIKRTPNHVAFSVVGLKVQPKNAIAHGGNCQADLASIPVLSRKSKRRIASRKFTPKFTFQHGSKTECLSCASSKCRDA
jgi:hypothetical protein